MSPTSWLERAGLGDVDGAHLGEVLLHLVVALVLGAVLAYRPWRRFMGRPSPSPEQVQAQVMIAVAGAVMVATIGDSVARAFGLVGLGGFIRFRSGIKDPRDAAVMFLMIGVGMACGIGLVALAVVTTSFLALVLLGFDLLADPVRPRQRVRFVVDDARAALPALRAAFADAALRVVTAPLVGAAPHALVVEMVVDESADAAHMHEQAAARGVSGLHEVEIVED